MSPTETYTLDSPFTAVLNTLQKRLKDTGGYDDMINLGLGNPGTALAPELQDVLAERARGDKAKQAEGSPGFFGYTSPVSTKETKKVLADFVTNIRGTDYGFKQEGEQYDQIAVTPSGITRSIQDYLQLLYNKEKKLSVLVPTPAYAWYFSAIKNIGRSGPGDGGAGDIDVIKLDTRQHGWKLDATSLQRALSNEQPDTIILNYPNNPTGQDLNEEEWKQVADVLRTYIADNHDHFRIILDNAYKELSFDDHKGLLEVAPDLMSHTIEFNSMAKLHAYAGQDGPGFAVSKNTNDIAMLNEYNKPHLGLGEPREELLREAFSSDFLTKERIEQTRRIYRKNCRFVANYVNATLGKLGDNHPVVMRPDGGMFAYADFGKWLDKKIDNTEARRFRSILSNAMPEHTEYFNKAVFQNDKINDDKDLSFYLLLKAHVVTLPGQDFDEAPKDGMLRLALGDIGETTSYKGKKPKPKFLTPYLDEQDRGERPYHTLRKLKVAMDRSIDVLRGLEQGAFLAT